MRKAGSVRASRLALVGLIVVALAGACDGDDDVAVPASSPTLLVSPTPVASPPPSASPVPTVVPTDLPPITVSQPIPGAEISSPVVIAGTADVFEATVSLRILDAAHHVLARDFTTATCGTGCRGDYETSVSFDVDEAQDGTVEVWWDSPKDGSRQDVVSIPVTLIP